MKPAFLVFFLLAPLLPISFAQDAATGITVSGSGVVYGEPDQAVIEVGVNVADEDLSVATDEAARRVNGLLEALAALDIDPQDVRTTRYNVWLEERYDDEGNLGTPRYRVDSSLSVTVRDFSRLGEVLARALEAGANTVGNVNFTLSDPSRLEARARELAVQDARRKAEQLAELAGVALGPVEMIDDTYTSTPPAPFPAARMQLESSAADVPVAGGQLSVSSSVQVRYAIGAQD